MSLVWYWSRGCLLILLCLTVYIEARISVSMSPYSDIFVVKGKPLSLSCTVSSDSSTVSVYNLSLALDVYCNNTVPAQYLTYTNQLDMYIPETTLKDDRTYFCCYNGQMRTLKTVYVGEMPEPPKSIHCVSLNWLQMTCYVELSQNKTYIPTNWTMEYKHGSDTKTFPCTEYNTEYNDDNASYFNCGNITGSNLLQYANYTIIVTGFSEDYNITIQNTTYIYTNDSIVKPAPVNLLNASKTAESSVVMVTWKFPRKLPPFINLTYRISLKTTEGWDDRTLVDDSITTVGNKDFLYQYILDRLIPSITYHISVSAKPVKAAGEWYWSEPAHVTMTTDPDVPANSTSLIEGSYYAVNCGVNSICPVIYWKNPERRYSNGIISGYQISIAELSSLNPNSSLSTQEPVLHSALLGDAIGLGYDDQDLTEVKRLDLTGRSVFAVLDENLLKTKNYLIHMRAGTKKGLSEAVSQLLIPSWNKAEDIVPHRVIVEIDEDIHIALLSWQLKRKELCKESLQQTVYWCPFENGQGNETFALCKDSFDWEVVPVSDGCGNSTWNVSLPAGIMAKDIKYGVSVSVDGISGGMIWESCRFDAMYQAPDIPLYRVDPVEDKHDELLITVLYENCYSSLGGKPVSYQVFFERFAGDQDDAICHEGADVLSFPTDFDNPVMYLNNLEVGTQYIVCLRAVSEYYVGNFGKPQVVKTSASPTAFTKWIWITLGIVLGVIVLIVLMILILCGIRYLRRKLRPIEIMDITACSKAQDEERPNGSTFHKQDERETDSGVGTNSLTDGCQPNRNSSAVNSLNSDLDESFIPTLAEQDFREGTSSGTPILVVESSCSSRRSSRSGYQQFIPFSNDDIYGECETDSLMENDEFKKGIDNDLDVANVIVDSVKRQNHVYIDIDDPKKELDNENYVDKEDFLKDLVPSKIQKELENNDYVDRENERTQKRGPNNNTLIDRENGPKDTVADKKQDRELCNDAYVDREDVPKVSKKAVQYKDMEIQNTVTCKKELIYSDNSKTKGSVDNSEYVEEEDMHKLADNRNSGQGLMSVQHMLSNMLPERKCRENRKLFSESKTHFPMKNLKASMGGLNLEEESFSADSEHKVVDERDVESKKNFTDNVGPETLNSGSSPNLGNNTLEETEENWEIENAIQNQSDVEQAHDSDGTVSPVNDFSDQHGENEDMFYQDVTFGDGELTDIIESFVKSQTNFGTVDDIFLTNGYVDADKISVGSFASNESSQDRQSPEKHVCLNKVIDHLNTNISPSQEMKNIFKNDITHLNKISEYRTTNTTENTKNKIDTSINGLQPKSMETNSLFLEKYQPSEIIETNSGSGISSYVAAGKVDTGNISSCERQNSPDNSPEMIINVATSMENNETSQDENNRSVDIKTENAQASLVKDETDVTVGENIEITHL